MGAFNFPTSRLSSAFLRRFGSPIRLRPRTLQELDGLFSSVPVFRHFIRESACTPRFRKKFAKDIEYFLELHFAYEFFWNTAVAWRSSGPKGMRKIIEEQCA